VVTEFQEIPQEQGQLPVQAPAQVQEPKVFFVNEVEITKSLFRKWSKPIRKINPLYYWTGIAIIIILAASSVLWSVEWFLSRRDVTLFAVVCVITALILTLMASRIRTNAVFRSIEQPPWIRTFVFGEHSVTVSKNDSQTTFSYDQFNGMKEFDDTFYLYHPTGFFVVCKDKFVVGDAAEFGEFFRTSCTKFMSEKEKKRDILKSNLFRMAYVVLIFALMFVPVRFIIRANSPTNQETIEQYMASIQGEQELIAYAHLPDGGAAIFFTEEGDIDRVTASLLSLNERSGRYSWIRGYSYSMTWFVEENERGWERVPIEEGGDFLTFAASNQAVVFGIGSLSWWNGLPQSMRDNYDFEEFRHGAGKFVIYYRVTDGGSYV
jgi:hypothetical protein